MLILLRKIITSGKTSLIFSVGLAATALWGNKINEAFIYIFIGIFCLYGVLYVAFSIIDWINLRQWLNTNQQYIVNKNVNHDWRIDCEGNFDGKYIYEVLNLGSEPISVLPFDDVLWFVNPSKMQFDCTLMENKIGRKIVSYRLTVVKYLLDFLKNDKDTKSIRWSNVIDPPIKKGETFKYKVSISTVASEINAFTEEGTIAGIPATIPTKQAKLHFISPKGYYFVLIDPVIVVDNRGKRFSEEEKGIACPILSGAKTILTWELENLQLGRRYWFKYRFAKEGNNDAA